jgi:hypothetical protein
MNSFLTRLLVILLLFFSAGVLIGPFVDQARAQGPIVATSQPLYTLRDPQVELTGSGFSTTTTYHVWVRKAGGNATSYASLSFTPVSGGLIPPATVLQLAPDDPLGTYVVSISTSPASDTGVAQAHFGVWGTIRQLYQRTEAARVLGGGLFPGGGAKLTIRNPAGNFVHDLTLLADQSGEFRDEWRIPADASLDVYSVFLDGTGTFDDPTREFVSLARFTVAPATLRVTIVNQPSGSYERTETASVTLEVRYPDTTAVTSLKSGSRPVDLLQENLGISTLNLTRVDPTLGRWRAEVKISANASLGTGYRFRLAGGAFDDGFGNAGAADELMSNLFEIRAASFRINAVTNQSSYQIGFDSIRIVSVVNYPDGTPLRNGTVTATISSGSWSTLISLTYDPQTGTWTGIYPTSLLDVSRIGEWTLTVHASDEYANLGETKLSLSVQPFVLALVIVIIVVLALVGNWLVRRYWRRILLRIRKFTLMVRRGRLSPSRPTALP